MIAQGLRLKFYSVQSKKGGMMDVIPVPCAVHLSSNSLPPKCAIQKLDMDLEGRYILVKFTQGEKRLLCQMEQNPLPKVGLLYVSIV
jgi:hypothetical protein